MVIQRTPYFVFEHRTEGEMTQQNIEPDVDQILSVSGVLTDKLLFEDHHSIEDVNKRKEYQQCVEENQQEHEHFVVVDHFPVEHFLSYQGREILRVH